MKVGVDFRAFGAEQFAQQGAQGLAFNFFNRAAEDVGVGEMAVGEGAAEAVKRLLGCQGHGR